MFRIADVRNAQVVEPKVLAYLYSWGDGRTTAEGEHIPFRADPLNIGYVDGMMLLPLTIEHTIDERSPLYGHTHDSLVVCEEGGGGGGGTLMCETCIHQCTHTPVYHTLYPMHTHTLSYTHAHCPMHTLYPSPHPQALQAEIVVTFEGTTEYGNPFMARQSYLPSEIHWGHQFAKIVHSTPNDSFYTVDIGRFHDVEPQRGLPMLPPARLSQLVVGRQVCFWLCLCVSECMHGVHVCEGVCACVCEGVIMYVCV